MEPFSQEQLNSIATKHGIQYEPIEDKNELLVRTKMSKPFPLAQKDVFTAFSDPVSHVGLFPIIKGSTKAIREGLEELLDENQFFAFEHVQESSLPPRIMIIKYTLEPPSKIVKEGVTDPFNISDAVVMDKKKAAVVMEFQYMSDQETNISVESSFETSSGRIFSRGFIDRVWFNFFENMMVANGQLDDADRLA